MPDQQPLFEDVDPTPLPEDDDSDGYWDDDDEDTCPHGADVTDPCEDCDAEEDNDDLDLGGEA